MKQDKTIAQLSGEYGVHSNQISRWKQHLGKEMLISWHDKLCTGLKSEFNKD
ncbi:MAG: hypothetical protein HF982_06520 [Desulfobacteraceae bacterium]|nr:hypothetical protein [Desulfobacteraceae bacterium]MBC2719228.1 hypothetical protein [Desulfobacteraceae bacterium]